MSVLTTTRTDAARRRENVETTRRRAAALFPGAGSAGGPGDDSGDGSDGAAGPDLPRALRRRERWRLAVLERLPRAVQLRCGLELKAVVALGVLAVVAVGFAVHHFWAGRPQSVEVPRTVRVDRPLFPVTSSPGPSAPARPTGVVVDVAGKVREPGVHRLPAGSRVTDALKAAGGALPGTDTSGLNLARVLGDGEQVLVGVPPPAGGTGPVGGGTGPAPAPAQAAPISLNSATAEQLDALPGVGPVLAKHIVDYRAQHGGFTSVDQLRDVNGIGERRFHDIKPLVRP